MSLFDMLQAGAGPITEGRIFKEVLKNTVSDFKRLEFMSNGFTLDIENMEENRKVTTLFSMGSINENFGYSNTIGAEFGKMVDILHKGFSPWFERNFEAYKVMSEGADEGFEEWLGVADDEDKEEKKEAA